MKQAAIILIVKDGLILAISRRYNPNIFGLPGGKFDELAGDKTPMDTAIRETYEETRVRVTRCTPVFQRSELGDTIKEDFYSYTFYAEEWEGEPTSSEEGRVAWLTAEELTSTRAAFGDYNRKMLDSFKLMFPEVPIQGE